MLSENSVKGLRVTKISKTVSLKGSGVSSNQKNFPETITHEIFETTYSFHMKTRVSLKLVFTKLWFSRVFCKYEENHYQGTLTVNYLSFYKV